MAIIWEKFEEEQRVRLDKEFRNTSIVTVKSQTSGRMYCQVSNGKSTWTVMTNRLTELTEDEKTTI